MLGAAYVNYIQPSNKKNCISSIKSIMLIVHILPGLHEGLFRGGWIAKT